MGKRGKHHAAAFHANPRFKLTAICDVDEARLQQAAPELGGPATGTDAATMANTIKPDVFCFCTLPSLRLDMIKIGVDCGARLIAFEKPVALTSAEGMRVRDLLAKSGTKAVVSHQHRYGPHYQAVKDICASGELGRIHTLMGTSVGWMTHMLSHLIDYLSWFNDYDRAEWVMAQASGRGKLSDNHPSPDYLAGVIQFAGGVRAVVECGAGAPDVPEVDYWWRKCRLAVHGTEGFAEVLTGGGWRSLTRQGGYRSGEGCMNYDQDMPPYIAEMADWLDDDSKMHICGFEHAYAGFEIMMGLCRSVVGGGQVALPLVSGVDERLLMSDRLPDERVLFSTPENVKEYSS